MHFALSFLLPVILFAGCSSAASGDTKVATSAYPVQFVTEVLGGSQLEVVNVTPPGVEPHDVELGSSEVIDLTEADLVVYIGGAFQPAVEEALADVEGAKIDALDASGGPVGEDAHFWLDPIRLADVTDVIAEQLAEIDPDNAEAFAAAQEDLERRLVELDAAWQEGLSDCDSKEIVVSHEAFGYLADRYGLAQTGISGLDPETEPSPQRIAEVADFVRANDVSTIFFETLLPPDAAETIARETGAKVATLDPLESRPENGDYFSTMERNLETLQEALGCR